MRCVNITAESSSRGAENFADGASKMAVGRLSEVEPGHYKVLSVNGHVVLQCVATTRRRLVALEDVPSEFRELTFVEAQRSFYFDGDRSWRVKPGRYVVKSTKRTEILLEHVESGELRRLQSAEVPAKFHRKQLHLSFDEAGFQAIT